MVKHGGGPTNDITWQVSGGQKVMTSSLATRRVTQTRKPEPRVLFGNDRVGPIRLRVHR